MFKPSIDHKADGHWSPAADAMAANRVPADAIRCQFGVVGSHPAKRNGTRLEA